MSAMFDNFDFDVIRRALPYLFREGMTFTLTLTALSALGGIVLGRSRPCRDGNHSGQHQGQGQAAQFH